MDCIGYTKYWRFLQHYNPIVDEATASEFDIPKTWKLIAQMPFGDVREEAKEKKLNLSKIVLS